MSRSKKSRLERMAGKIAGIRVSHDEEGNYLNYCTFGAHFGVIGERKAQECARKKCSYLRKYREE